MRLWRVLHGVITLSTSLLDDIRNQLYEHSIALGWRFGLDTSIGIGIESYEWVHSSQNKEYTSAKSALDMIVLVHLGQQIVPALLQRVAFISHHAFSFSLPSWDIPVVHDLISEYPGSIIHHPHILNDVLQTLYEF